MKREGTAKGPETVYRRVSTDNKQKEFRSGYGTSGNGARQDEGRGKVRYRIVQNAILARERIAAPRQAAWTSGRGCARLHLVIPRIEGEDHTRKVSPRVPTPCPKDPHHPLQPLATVATTLPPLVPVASPSNHREWAG